MTRKCPTCGLVNFVEATSCRRCGRGPAETRPRSGDEPSRGSTGQAAGEDWNRPSESSQHQGPTRRNSLPQTAPAVPYGSAPYQSRAPSASPTPAKKPITTAGILITVLIFVAANTLTTSLMSGLPATLRVMIYAGLAAGLIAGLIPFFVARNRGQKKLAVLSLLVCTVCGGAFGLLLALPAAILLTVAAVLRKPPEGT